MKRFVFLIVFLVGLIGGGEVWAVGGIDLGTCQMCGCECVYVLPGDMCSDVYCEDDVVCGVVVDECVECPMNTKRDLSGNCVCVAGYIDADGDVLTNGCEVHEGCSANMERNTEGDCVCMAGYIDADGDVLTNGCEVHEGCSANMERNTEGDCVCSERYADCDGDGSNGCETEGFCTGCSQNSDCSFCGSTCHSGMPAGTSCAMFVPLGSCDCVNGMCEVRDSCSANMERNDDSKKWTNWTTWSDKYGVVADFLKDGNGNTIADTVSGFNAVRFKKNYGGSVVEVLRQHALSSNGKKLWWRDGFWDDDSKKWTNWTTWSDKYGVVADFLKDGNGNTIADTVSGFNAVRFKKNYGGSVVEVLRQHALSSNGKKLWWRDGFWDDDSKKWTNWTTWSDKYGVVADFLKDGNGNTIADTVSGFNAVRFKKNYGGSVVEVLRQHALSSNGKKLWWRDGFWDDDSKKWTNWTTWSDKYGVVADFLKDGNGNTIADTVSGFNAVRFKKNYGGSVVEVLRQHALSSNGKKLWWRDGFWDDEDCVCMAGYVDCDGNKNNGCETKGDCGAFGDCIETGGDYNGDGVFDVANDLIGWYVVYRGNYDARADFNCDDEVDISDLIEWYVNYRNPRESSGCKEYMDQFSVVADCCSGNGISGYCCANTTGLSCLL